VADRLVNYQISTFSMLTLPTPRLAFLSLEFMEYCIHPAAGLAPGTPSRELDMDLQPLISSLRRYFSVFLISVRHRLHTSQSFPAGKSRLAQFAVYFISVFFWHMPHAAGSHLSRPFNYLPERIYFKPHPFPEYLEVGVHCSSDSSYSYKINCFQLKGLHSKPSHVC